MGLLLFLEPTWLQTLAKIGITAWAMEGLNGSMISGKGFIDILPDNPWACWLMA